MPGIVTKHFQTLPLLLLPCFWTVCSASSTITNISTDQLALLALKSPITELPTHHVLSKNWTVGASVCDWIGVTCGSRHLRVTALDLNNMNLTGTIPPHLGNLSYLVSLNMTFNSFSGGLPYELARNRRLKALNMSFNHLDGEFPPWIGSLQELEHLDLSNNSFTGVIPQSISNISKLAVFMVSYNYLQWKFPIEIFNMSYLEWISFDFNSFSAGSLPDDMCGRLPKMKTLGLGNTNLIGQIASSIGQCLELRRLYLFLNSLTGEIPREIANLTELRYLLMWRNQLDGNNKSSTSSQVSKH